VVVAHGRTTLLSVSLALGGLDVPFVYRSVGDPSFWAPLRGRELRVGRPLRAAQSVVVLWHAAATNLMHLYGLPAAHLAVIPTGVHPEAFVPLDPPTRARLRATLGFKERTPLAAFVGPLSPEKRPELALAAARRGGFHLLVVGDGPLRGQLEQEAGGDATFFGAVKRPQDVVRAAHVLVLTSETEGVPAVLIEAGLCGVPAVAVDVGGVSEVVVDGTTGRLVSSASPAALAQAMREVAGRAGYAAAARRRCLARFTMDRITDQWEALLLRAVRSPGGPPSR
jgi:glycosyltransferase involved in cell wall biosynthesis